MVWSAMSRDRDPGSPETGHHRLHNVRCSTMPTVAPAPPPRRLGLGRCRRGAQDRSRWCGIDCGADTRDSRGVDPAVRVSGAGGGVARQFERGDHLDGPSHEVSSGLGEDPGGRTGGHRGGSASKAAALPATTRRRIRTGRGRLELGCVDRACRRPRRRPGTGPRLPVPGARCPPAQPASNPASSGEGGGGGWPPIPRMSFTHRAKVATSSPTSSPRSTCSMAASNWAREGMSGKRSPRVA